MLLLERLGNNNNNFSNIFFCDIFHCFRFHKWSLLSAYFDAYYKLVFIYVRDYGN